ncbi:MAG: hypothetical protein AAFQ81_11940, partial [Pseudomonadota bacterium]
KNATVTIHATLRAIACAGLLAIIVPERAGAEGAVREPNDQPQRYARITEAPERGIDCTFFVSQAFNQGDTHFTVQMARMCVMLSRYKTTVIDANSSRFRAARAADLGSSAAQRIAPMESAPESSKYLIAREIGLIDALASLSRAETRGD